PSSVPSTPSRPRHSHGTKGAFFARCLAAACCKATARQPTDKQRETPESLRATHCTARRSEPCPTPRARESHRQTLRSGPTYRASEGSKARRDRCRVGGDSHRIRDGAFRGGRR